MKNNSHSLLLGYILWIFGFMGAHRFYYAKPLSGSIYFFTFGLFGIGWFVDLFLIPSMDKEADIYFKEGELDYNICWLLLIFLGYFGIHRFYMKKYFTGLVWLLTGGLFAIGWLYDLWTLNDQIQEENQNLISQKRMV